MSGFWDRTKCAPIVVHHLGNNHPPLDTKVALWRAANPNNYEFPEYDFGILASGEVVKMRPLEYVGAHTAADRAGYMWGSNWWNRNSVSIVVACDCEKFAPTKEQVDSLVRFLREWVKGKGVGTEVIFPHNIPTRTACPGKFLDWGVVMEGVKGVIEPVDTVKNKPIIVYFGDKDKGCAEALAEKYAGCICRRSQENVWKHFELRYFVGGADVKDGKLNVNLCGYTFADTLELVAKELRK